MSESHRELGGQIDNMPKVGTSMSMGLSKITPELRAEMFWRV